MTTDSGKSMIALTLMSLLFLIVLSPTYSAYASSSGEGWETAFTVGKFVYSDPLKPDQIFKVQYRVINRTIESFNSPQWITAKVNSTGDGMLEIKFPRNYPYKNHAEDTEGRNAEFFLNDQSIIVEEPDVTDCFFVFSIPFNGSSKIGLAWSYLLWQEPYHGDSIPDSCIPQTVVEDVPVKKDGTISPLKQIKAGVAPQDVICPDDGHMLLISPQDRPYCASESTVTKLRKQWQEISGVSCEETALYSRWECSSMAADGAARITVTVDVGSEPRQGLVPTGRGNSSMTTYLPVKITQAIELPELTERLTLYPIFEN